MSTPGREFYDRQIEFLANQDVNGLIDAQYHPQATLVGFEFPPVHGTEALKTHFTNYLANLGKIELISTDQFVEIDDAIFFEATVRTAHGVAVVYDVFTFQDGKAIRHFTGLKEFRPDGG